jgi:hypothetical protein
MKVEIEPMQQPVHKMVGRPLTVSQQLVHLEDCTAFLKKFAPEVLANREGDCYAVKKVVGRPRR